MALPSCGAPPSADPEVQADRWLAQYAASEQDREISRQSLRFNPFTLAAEIEGLEVRDKLVPYDLGRRMQLQQLRKTGYLLRNLHRGLTRIKLKFFGRKMLGLLRSS